MKTIQLLIAVCICANVIAQKDTVRVAAIMQKATVYYGYGAELNHSAKVSVNRGTRFIVLEKLSKELDLNSLQVSCPENISLLSQQFEVYYPTAVQVKPKISKNAEQLKKMKDSVKNYGKTIAVIGNNIDIETTILVKTEKLIESTIATSGNKTSLNTDVLKLIDYYNTKVEKNKKSIFTYRTEIDNLNEKIGEINERISILENEVDAEPEAQPDEEKLMAQKGYGRIIMQVMCNAAEQADLKLSYFTNAAGWQPMYDMRVDSKTNDIKFVYKASITQNTGLTWKNVQLTLKTGSPNFTTEAPLLSSWYLQLYAPQVYKALQGKANGISMNTAVAPRVINNEINAADYVLEDRKDATEKGSTLDDYVTLKQGLLNTSFEIELPYDIESNGKPHTINVKSSIIKSKISNYSVPKLDGESYLLAQVTDWQNLDLLPGNANIILDDTYIGRSFINPNTTLDTLNLSLGKDKRVVVKRTLVKDASKTRNKDNFTTKTFLYELTVRNNKTKDIVLVLKDQYPLSNVSEIEVKLVDDGGARINEEVGSLTWEMNLQPGEVKKVKFEYTVKYPKDKKIQNL